MNDGSDTERAMASAEIVVDACDCHPNSSDADRQHTPVGGKHEPDGVVITIEATSLVQEVGDDPGDQKNCDYRPVYNVRRRHTTDRPLTKYKRNDQLYIYQSVVSDPHSCCVLSNCMFVSQSR